MKTRFSIGSSSASVVTCAFRTQEFISTPSLPSTAHFAKLLLPPFSSSFTHCYPCSVLSLSLTRWYYLPVLLWDSLLYHCAVFSFSHPWHHIEIFSQQAFPWGCLLASLVQDAILVACLCYSFRLFRRCFCISHALFRSSVHSSLKVPFVSPTSGPNWCAFDWKAAPHEAVNKIDSSCVLAWWEQVGQIHHIYCHDSWDGKGKENSSYLCVWVCSVVIVRLRSRRMNAWWAGSRKLSLSLRS